MQVSPALYSDLEKVYACDAVVAKIEPEVTPLIENKIEAKIQPKIKKGRNSK